MNVNSYEWITPLGSLTSSVTLEEVIAQIEQGRAFPPQQISVEGSAATAAFLVPELSEVWDRVTPPQTPFKGASGRVRPLYLGRLLAQLSLNRSTGYLYLRQSDTGLYFAFRFVEGQVLEVCAHDPSTYLGQLLVQQQILTPDELTQALNHAREHGEAIGKVCVDLGFINIKELNQSLAEQIFTRLRRISCFPKSDVLFRPDRRARMSPPVARVSGYSLLEICLGYGLRDGEIKDYIRDLLARPIQVDRSSKGIQLLSAEDRSVLKRIESSGDLKVLTQRSNWTHRDGALKAIAWDLIQIFKIPKSYQLSQEYKALDQKDALNYLGISPYSTPEELKSIIQTYSDSIRLNELSESEEEEQFKNAIRLKLKELEVSSDISERERNILNRMRQMGANLADDVLKQNLLFDACIQEGEAALKKQKYQEAKNAFSEAISFKRNDMNALLKEVWSSFLVSDRSPNVYRELKKRMEALIHRFPNSPDPLLTLAQIQRLCAEDEHAENNLRKVLKMKPNHVQAQAELRLLLNREFDKKKRKVKMGGMNQNKEHGLWNMAVISLLGLTVFLWGTGNFVPHTRDIWPELKPLNTSESSGLNEFERKRNFAQVMRTNYKPNLIASSAYRLGLKPHRDVEGNDDTGYKITTLEGGFMKELSRCIEYLYVKHQKEREIVLSALRRSQVIPIDQRVIGNVEHYWLTNDLFAWMRRAFLMFIGIFGLTRVKPLELKVVGSTSMLFVALIYGAIVGFMSPIFYSPTPQVPLMGMKIIHVLSEQLCFTFFLGLALLKGFEWRPWIPALIIVSIFAIYKISFLSVWYKPSFMMGLSMLQIGLFIGGGSFLLFWKSRGVLPPIVAHLTLTFVPLLRGLS